LSGLALLILLVLYHLPNYGQPTDFRASLSEEVSTWSRQGPWPLGRLESSRQEDLADPRCDMQPPRETFSQLTLFLFGSGLALFVALLGWSDQIRGINQDTRDLEIRFLETTRIDKTDFLSVVKPSSPEERLAALTQIMVSGKAKTVANVEVLGIFTQWHKEWTKLEALFAWKYRLALTLTWTLLAAGIISLRTNPESSVSLFFFRIRADLLILAVPILLIAAILVIIAIADHRQSQFLRLLASLAERV
jgi:hypothetical protein